MRIILLATIVATALCGVGTAQDLGQLRSRAERFLEARVEGNPQEAVDYVRPSDRSDFLRSSSSVQILDLRLAGLDFTDDPETIVARVEARMMFPGLAQTAERTIEEDWVWIEGNWFRALSEVTNPFLATTTEDFTPALPESEPPRFEILAESVDLGRWQQGALVRGELEFEADGQNISISADSDFGLALEQVVWNDATTGTIGFNWDTSMRWTDLQSEVRMVATDRLSGFSTEDRIEVRGEIEGRLSMVQSPTLANPHEPGTIEVELQNLTSGQMTVSSGSVANSIFEADFLFESLGPGETGVVRVEYPAMERVSGAGVNITFREAILNGSSTVDVPLLFETDAELNSPVGYSPEEIERILRENNVQR